MDNNDKDFNYVEQKIKPKNRKKVKKVIAIIALTIVAAVLFGFLSRLVFVASEGAVNRILGITPTPTPTPVESTNGRSQVTLGSTSTPTPSPSPTPTPTTIPVVLDPTIEPSPTPTEAPSETPTPDPGAASAPTDVPEADPIADYLKMISQMRAIAGKAGESLVRVYAVTSGVNWMDESIETRTERTGILVADNGVELLILAEYNAFSSADRIEIEFRDGAVAEGSIYMADPDSGLAVIEVELTDISASTIATCKYVSLGDSDGVIEGEPVIALGRPNGYYGAVEFGFVSHAGLTKYFIDGVHFGFTTDIVSGSSPDGMVIDLEGKLVGLIVPDSEGERITVSAIYINSVKTLLLKLLNGNPLPYFGVRAENVPKDILIGMGLENGIYVNEVIAASPAAEAGVKKGDVIVGIDDVKIESVTDFYEYIFSLEEGSTVRVDIYHSGMRDEPAEEISAVLSVK
ncbi:MAG: PDZ domain-containing protein [Lachnospiraceae bacterium]|nr:PDZ domain-containing protein [Lachnospiraceae bacterium]